jgi:hypothetical protein
LSERCGGARVHCNGAGIGHDDYVDDAHLPRIIALLEQNTHRIAGKAKEWRHETKIYINLNLNEDN